MKSQVQSKQSSVKSKPKKFIEVVDGVLHINPHPKQKLVFESEAPITLVLAGRQSGKTVCGPIWMYNQILEWDKRVQKDEVVEDAAFLSVSPSFPLLDKKLFPTYEEFFVNILQIATYKVQKKVFDIKIRREDKTSRTYQLFLESAQKDTALASVTAAAAHCDEVGMDSFSLKSWRELEGRMGSTGGKILLTSTIYNWGWMKRLLYDQWTKGSKRINVVRFESIDNPFFDRDLWDSLKNTMPTFDFNMQYRGIYDRPAGKIYDVFDPDVHVIPRFDIPLSTARYVGIDPGIVHHCTTWAAQIEPYDPEYEHFPLADNYNPVFVVYRVSLTGSTTTTKSNAEHAQEAMAQPDASSVRGWHGGSKSEKYFRADYLKEGINVHEPPFSEVEAGISTLYKFMKQNRFYIFDDLKILYEPPLEGEDRSIPAYSRTLDDYGNPMTAIKDKSEWHVCDTLRYLFLGVDTDVRPGYANFVSLSGRSLLDI